VDQHHRFVLTRTMTGMPSRRDVLRALGAAGVGLGALQPNPAAAKKKGKGKRKNKKKERPKIIQPVLNAFGCLDIGQPCRGDGNNCCSGICEGVAPKKGRPDTSNCVAHNSGICATDTNSCELGVAVPCATDSSLQICVITTGGAPFCGDFTAGVQTLCRNCTKDTECEAEFGAGAACIVLGGTCTLFCPATGRTACVPPAA